MVFLIVESVGSVGASLCIPDFTKGQDHLSAEQVETARNIANVSIKIEQLIGCVRQRYTILSATGVFQKEYFQHKSPDGIVLIDAIVRVCCALNNMCGGVVPFS